MDLSKGFCCILLDINFTKLIAHDVFDAAMKLTYSHLNIVKNLLRKTSHNVLLDLKF